MMTIEEIEKKVSKQLKVYENIVTEEFKKTVPCSFEVRKPNKRTPNPIISDKTNRQNSGVLRNQFIFFYEDSLWKNSASEAKRYLRSDQRVFVQISDDVWDVYQGNETTTPDKIISGTGNLEKLLKEQILMLVSQQMDSNSPLQQIFYGAPGTGKSFEINKRTKGKDVIRTTFHPDSDYSTFVGCYKPIMGAPKPIYGFDSKGNTVKATDLGKEIPEQKIEYKFVKQAFLKAYVEAWKKLEGHASSTKGISFSVGTASYAILSVDDKGLQQSKTDQINKNIVERVWKKLWESGSFVIPRGKMSGESVQQAISKWIYDNIKKDNFTEGWEKLIEQLKENEIEVGKDDTKSSKKYTLSKSQNNNSVLFSAESGNTKERIQKCYEGYDEANGVEKGIIDILNNYGVDNFDDAWKKLREEVENSNLTGDAVAPQFLIIEEINRGNCAQIFGDIFQLLDRQGNGFSEYPIEADSDLQEAIAEELQYVDIKVDWALANYKSTISGSTLSEDIKAGRILLLPNNLYIWATMNTSDQSLFPMDSAFKRRWDWECIPIDYENEKSKTFNITINGVEYNWHDFLKVVNKKILDATGSEDKQMGNFFIKGDVDEKQFINKVMFYLWNDVCKEEYGTNNNFFRYYKDSEKKETEPFTFNKLFESDAKDTLNNFMVYMEDELAKIKKPEDGIV